MASARLVAVARRMVIRVVVSFEGVMVWLFGWLVLCDDTRWLEVGNITSGLERKFANRIRRHIGQAAPVL